MGELRDLVRKLNDQTVLALNEFFEARSEFAKLADIAYAAVSYVVLNRSAHSTQFQDSLQEVVAVPASQAEVHRFEPCYSYLYFQWVLPYTLTFSF